MGSTSYDEATGGPLDPGWSGAAWYGTDSGTYWTVNPREYADPRKHGPEYLERARRARAEEGPSAVPGNAGAEAAWDPSPTWSSSGPRPAAAGRDDPLPADASGPRYPGLAAFGIAITGTILAIAAIVALFARP
jgi:hypothetical protein